VAGEYCASCLALEFSWRPVRADDDQRNPDRASRLTLHLLVRTQRLALMAAIYEDRTLVKREVESINAWLESQA